MKRLFTLCAIVIAVAVSSCSKFDDTPIWDKLNDHESRITALEELCKQMNTNIDALQTLVEALEKRDYITNVSPVREDGVVIGYTISFADSDTITIYHGENGKDGADGKDGYTPQIGVMKDTDGIYYWTLDGEWLLDGKGNKIQANGVNGIDGTDGSNGEDGTNGVDGITPRLKIENDYWYVSYDEGASWIELGKATGEDGSNGIDGVDGDSIFSSVTQDDEYVYFNMADGTMITLPKHDKENIQFEDLQVKAICCKNWDTNNDGELSYAEAAAVTDIGTTFKGNKEIISFAELKYFTGLTEIADYAFQSCTNLWKVVLPSSIVQICVGAFQGCKSIRFIAIPSKVEVIGEMSFKDCISINRLQIPDSVLIIKDEAFLGCIGVEEVVLGKNVSIIASKAFYNCSTISNIIFGENLITIGDNAFNGCSSIAELNIPNSVTTIEDGAFRYCKGLQNLYIPSSVTTLGVNITELCTGVLFIDCDIPNGENTYYSSGNDTIGFSSVFNRSNFTKVIFGDNVRYVGQYSFSLCHNLTTLEFGENITKISGDAFHADNDNHGRISTVFVKSMVPPYQSNSFHQWYWGYSYGYYYTKMPSDLTIYVPRIAEDDYKAQWSVYSDKIVGYDF